jgi:hypothetical protein
MQFLTRKLSEDENWDDVVQAEETHVVINVQNYLQI